MGERSKLIGEYGENIVENFLKLIGWQDCIKGLSVECIRDVHEVKTHGVDFFFNYLSPLVDSTLNRIFISVKNSHNPYPDNPTSTFKKHSQDIFNAIECAKYSEEVQDLNTSFKGYQQIRNIGVLFYISSGDDLNSEIISKIQSATLNRIPFDQYYVVDNSRLHFIFSCIRYAKSLSSDSGVTFVYQETGKNINPGQKIDDGLILPVEFINTTILALKVNFKGSNENRLALFSFYPFDSQDLIRLVNLAQNLSKSWPNEVIIGFPDYQRLEHIQQVSATLNKFDNSGFTKKIKVVNFHANFISSID